MTTGTDARVRIETRRSLAFAPVSANGIAMPITQHIPIILASGSAARQQLLRAAGLTFSVEPSGVDEEAIAATIAHAPLPQRALALARAKALKVGEKYPDSYTIGADQICAMDGEIFHKPGTHATACAQLAQLAGQAHQQHCGMVLVHQHHVIFEHAAMATLTMRALSAEEIRAYVAADAPLAACGAYHFESLGRHLFSHVEGDHDVIKGLPLVTLLAQLHALKVIAIR